MENTLAGDIKNAPEIADMNREAKSFFSWQPSRSLLASIRAYQNASNAIFGTQLFLKKCAMVRYRVWSIVTGAEIPVNLKIGGGLLLPHPNGIVIHCDSKIGFNCLIFQQVTIGSRDSPPPTIGNHVDIGAGAKILGQITIGDYAKIGANAVVLTDVPAYATAVGVPAKIYINKRIHTY